MQSLSSKLPWALANPKWAAALNAILGLPILNGNQINGINLPANVPMAINTMLGRMQQGWFLTDITSNANVWRTKPFNSYTLSLEASAATTISIWVY